jgi:AraC-like DNA-binding protein
VGIGGSMPEPTSFLPAVDPLRRHSYPTKLGSRRSGGMGEQASVQRGAREPQRSRTAAESIGLPSARLKRVLEYIEAHLGENISLTELARHSSLSVYYFATQFRKSTGLSPHQFILQRRVHRARELLRTTSLTVLDVSLDLGFQHQNNFTRAFRRVTGMTPTRFRLSHGSDHVSE